MAARTYILRGFAYDRKGNLEHSIADFTKAIMLDPKNALAYENRGLAYSAQGEQDRAIRDYDQQLQLEPKNASGYINRGLAYRRKGDVDQAITDYNEAIALDPKSAVAYLNRGLAYEDSGDLDRARADYRTTLTRPFRGNNTTEAYGLARDRLAALATIAPVPIKKPADPQTKTPDAASCVAVQSQAQPGNAQKCARIALAQEFVRELEVLYRLKETAKKEFAEDNSGHGKLITGIRVGTRTILQMNDSINRLNMIDVDARWAEFRDMLKQLHQQRIVLVQEMNQMSKALLSGPEPGVNYGKMTARAPELTAQIEQIDKNIFTMAQPMFFALVDDARVDADGKLHHLLLTRKDRTSMVQLIDKIFGPTLEDKNASHIVSAAWAIKYGLTRPHYKAADEL